MFKFLRNLFRKEAVVEQSSYRSESVKMDLTKPYPKTLPRTQKVDKTFRKHSSQTNKVVDSTEEILNPLNPIGPFGPIVDAANIWGTHETSSPSSNSYDSSSDSSSSSCDSDSGSCGCGGD